MDIGEFNDCAIVLGISHYEELPELAGPTKDAKAVADWLMDPAGGSVRSENLHLLLDHEATRDSVERALGSLVDRARTERLRRLYVYAQGHGYTTDSADVALLFSDGSEKLPGSAIDLVAFADSFVREGLADEVVLWVDADRRHMRGNPARPPWETQQHAKESASYLYGFAVPAGREAYGVVEPGDSGVHGLFTAALLEGLRGAAADSNGRVDSRSLADFVTRRVDKRANELGAPGQIPEFRHGGGSSIVFGGVGSSPDLSSESHVPDPKQTKVAQEPVSLDAPAAEPNAGVSQHAAPADPSSATGKVAPAKPNAPEGDGWLGDAPEVPAKGFSRRARTGLEFAARLAKVGGKPIDSVAILAGVMASAQQDDRVGAAKVVWERLAKAAGTTDPLAALALGEEFGIAELPAKGARVRPPEGFDDDGRALLVAARRLGNEIDQKDRVAVRHLLIGLLEPVDPAPRVQAWLAEHVGVELDELRTALAGVLDGFWAEGGLEPARVRGALGLAASPEGADPAQEDVADGPEAQEFALPPDGYTPRAQHGLTFARWLADQAGVDVDPARMFAGLMLQSRLETGEDVGAPEVVWRRISSTLGITDHGEALRLSEAFGAEGPPEEPGDFVAPPRGMTPEALDVLSAAAEHARAASLAVHVAARHLLSALLGPSEVSGSVSSYLRDSVGVDVSELRQGFYNDMASHGFGTDDPDAWRVHLGLDQRRDGRVDRELAQRPLAGYDPDHVRLGARREETRPLEDRLGIEGDVDALSKVAMAADVEPPMSIGLFGDWGSGKTYFMGLMDQEVVKLEAAARQAHATGQRTVYCRDVAQIHFNAWHFIDTNLWASIVTRIFSELARHFDPTGEKPDAWDQALSETEHAGAKLRSANDTLETAADAVTRAKDEEESRSKDVQEIDEKIQARLEAPKFRDYLAAALQDDAIKPQLESVAIEVGVDTLKDSVDDLTAEVRKARSLSGRIRSVWRSLGGSNGSWGRRLGLLAVAAILIAAPGIASWLLSTELADTARVILTGGAGFLGLITNRLLTLRPAFEAADGALARLEQVHQAVQDQATYELRSERERLMDLRAVARQRLEAARREHERALSEQEEAEHLRERVRTGAFIGDFIRAQSEKPDYKDQLGIIDEIRRDFEALSRLLRHVSQDNPEIRRLDRIILYIDDLDRCPTERVVEVLQAIHLLLAFELFVVVVGVDSRWLLHALEEQYSAFSGLGGNSTVERLRWRTTPQNYLEKIFQIPFTLRPMGAGGFSELIEHLTRERESQEGDHGEGGEAGAPPPETPPGDAGALPEEGETDPPELRTGRPLEGTAADPERGSADPEGEGGGAGEDTPRDGPSPAAEQLEAQGEPSPGPDGEPEASDAPASPSSGGSDADGGEETSGGGEPPAIDPAPPELLIGPDERRLMKRLDELIPTPRAAKRFVNLYRLIKATIRTEAELAEFLGTPERAGDYQAVMLMLAMQAGFPTPAYEVFRHLSLKPRGSWWDFVAGLEPVTDGSGAAITSLNLTGLSDAEAERWRELHRALAAQRAGMTMPDDLRPFVEHATAVARFGFVTGRAIAPERGPTRREPEAPLD